MKTLSDEKVKADNVKYDNGFFWETDVKEFIKRRLERIDLIIKMYPHKKGKELAGQLKEDLMNDAGKDLI